MKHSIAMRLRRLHPWKHMQVFALSHTLPTASLDCSRLFTRAVKVLNLLLVRQPWQWGAERGRGLYLLCGSTAAAAQSLRFRLRFFSCAFIHYTRTMCVWVSECECGQCVCVSALAIKMARIFFSLLCISLPLLLQQQLWITPLSFSLTLWLSYSLCLCSYSHVMAQAVANVGVPGRRAYVCVCACVHLPVLTYIFHFANYEARLRCRLQQRQ